MGGLVLTSKNLLRISNVYAVLYKCAVSSWSTISPWRSPGVSRRDGTGCEKATKSNARNRFVGNGTEQLEPPRLAPVIAGRIAIVHGWVEWLTSFPSRLEFTRPSTCAAVVPLLLPSAANPSTPPEIYFDAVKELVGHLGNQLVDATAGTERIVLYLTIALGIVAGLTAVQAIASIFSTRSMARHVEKELERMSRSLDSFKAESDTNLKDIGDRLYEDSNHLRQELERVERRLTEQAETVHLSTREATARLEKMAEASRTRIDEYYDRIPAEVRRISSPLEELIRMELGVLDQKIQHSLQSAMNEELDSRMNRVLRKADRRISEYLERDFAQILEKRYLAVEHVRQGVWTEIAAKINQAHVEGNTEQVVEWFGIFFKAQLAFRQLLSDDSTEVMTGIGILQPYCAEGLVPADSMWNLICLLKEQGKLGEEETKLAQHLGESIGKTFENCAEHHGGT